MSDELNIDLGELTAEQLGLTAEAPTGGITAFIVIKQPNGDWYATADLSTGTEETFSGYAIFWMFFKAKTTESFNLPPFAVSNSVLIFCGVLELS